MTRNEFIQTAAIAHRTNGMGHIEAWAEAERLADAAPKSTFDAPAARPAATGGATGAVFPNFGSSKGEPIHGASERNLRFYAHASMRTLGDSEKARFHDKERTMLAAYVNELERQGKDAADFDVKRPRQDDPPEPTQRQASVPDDVDLPF